MYQSYIGIDISKSDFIVNQHGQSRTERFENQQAGYTSFYEQHQKSLSGGFVVLETTGGYEQGLLTYLQAQGVAVHRAQSCKVKHFIRSLGHLGKTDRLDAKGLARYAYERHTSLRCYKAQEALLQQLRQWVERRLALKRMVVQEKNRRQAPGQTQLAGSFNAVIHALEQEIEAIDERLAELKEQIAGFKAKLKDMQTIPGIGDRSALMLLALLPELGQLTRRQVASLAGLAPHPYESGKKISYRKTTGGRIAIKPILFMVAMAASRSKSRLGAFYHHLIAAGKKKMVALTALMRKIVVIANAKMRDLLRQDDLLTT